jgi:hypothetical protein
MAITTWPTQKTKESQTIQATPLQEIVETIREDALTLAQDRLTGAMRGLDLKQLFRRPDFVDNFKYELASGVATALSDNDPRVEAIYTYEPSGNPDSELGNDMPVDATVHLLVKVQASSAALVAFMAALDRALTASLRDLPSPQYSERESILDVNLITEKDIEEGRGYAVLLSSMFAPPLKVWQR